MADLQDALMALVGRGVLLAAESDLNRARLLVGLRRERADQNYGRTTSRLVQQFQQERRLAATGAVAERTAAALARIKSDIWYYPFPESGETSAWLYIAISIVIALTAGFTTRKIYAIISRKLSHF